MASWLQAQLKAAENLLEAVDRTVSATSGAPVAPPEKDSSTGSSDFNAVGGVHQAWQPAGNGSGSQGQHGGSPLLPAGVSKGLGWLQGSPKPSSSPAQGSPAHPAAVAAGVSGTASKQQSQQLWHPFVPQSPSSGSAGFAARPSPQAAAATSGSPMHSTTPPAAALAGSIGSYTSRMQGPFSSSSSGSKQSMSPQVDRFLPAGTKQQTPPLANSAIANGEAVPATAANASAAPLGLSQPQAVVSSAAQDEAANSNGLMEAAQPSSGSTQKLIDTTETDEAAGLQAGEPSAALSGSKVTDDAASLLASSTVQGQEQRHESTDATATDAAAAALSSGGDDAAGTASSSGAASTLPGPTAAAAAAAANAPAPAAVAASDHPVASGSGAPSAESSQDGSAGREEQVQASAAAPAGLASAAAAAGAPGKEAQLTRLVETLRKRLEVVRGENQQLEDMLHEAEQRSSAEQATIAKLTAELTAVHHEQEGLVSSAAANAAAQDAHIGRLQAELEASNRQVAALQAELHAVQEQHAQALSSKDDMEGGALEALRAEVATYEGQLESERRAHTATKAAAASRERDLEEQLGSSSEALAAIQRQLEEASSRTREAEQQHMLAAAEVARLQQQVQQLGEQQSSSHVPDPHLQLQIEAEREAHQRRVEEAEAQAVAALQAQRAAEGRIAELQGEVAHLHSSYQAQAASRGAQQLEQQLRELQELLFQKQQQLERLSGEKQAQQLMLERQITSLKSELGKAHAAAAAAVTGVHLRSGHDIIPMDALGEPYQRLARHNKLGGAVQATARFLDTTAASASQLLRQQPLARLVVFLYIVLIHLYVYFLLARMQKQALQLFTQQDKALGIGPEHVSMQVPPAAVLPPPFPPPAVGHP